MHSNEVNKQAKDAWESLISAVPLDFYQVPKTQTPDVWLYPGQLWYLGCKSMRKSPYKINRVKGEITPSDISISSNVFILL